MNTDHLYCFDLDQPQLEGFRRFISSWLLVEEHFTALVDPGPLSTIPTLVNGLREKGIQSIDYILLTHIHIDHAGGTGELLKYFPTAQVICHPDGIRHMIAPERLWQGSLQVLGEMAQTYGEIIAVDADKISFTHTIGDTGLEVYETPGHAPHHLCFKYDDLLFGGEVCGVHSLVDEGIYMRPATPPRFMQDVAIASIDRMIALNPRYLIIAHHGLVEPATTYLKIGRQQLILWVQAVAATEQCSTETRQHAIYQWLIERDEVFSRIDQLEADLYARERYFMGNSLRGMIDYYEQLSTDQQQAILASI